MFHGFSKEASRCRIEAFRNIHFQRILGLKDNATEDRFDRIPTRTSRAKAIGMWRKLGFPCGFQRLAHERLLCPVVLSGNSQRAFVATAPLRYPRASQWRCLAIETEGIGEL